MEAKLLIISAISLIMLIDQSFCQTNDFVIVNLVEYPPTNVSDVKFRCSGTIIATEFIVTTANCANVAAPNLLGVQWFLESIQGIPVEYFSEVSNVSIHPQYTQKPVESNIAVVKVNLKGLNSILIRNS